MDFYPKKHHWPCCLLLMAFLLLPGLAGAEDAERIFTLETSIARALEDNWNLKAQKEKVVPEKGEKYQEVSQAEGLQPGFYLIANVFSTKRYYNIFMQRLQDRGLEPRSFYRSTNKFNYVYLGRYNSIEEARKARDSQFGGRYQGELWIFRVR